FRFAENKLFDVRMVRIQDDHLGGATSLAARLNDAREGVKAFHEAQWPAGSAATAEAFRGRTQRRKIRASTRSPLEQHAFGFGESQNGIERIFDGVDEAGRTLRLLVAGDPELYLLRLRIPVPILAIGVGLDAIAAHVEPHRRIEGGILAKKYVGQFIMESGSV